VREAEDGQTPEDGLVGGAHGGEREAAQVGGVCLLHAHCALPHEAALAAAAAAEGALPLHSRQRHARQHAQALAEQDQRLRQLLGRFGEDVANVVDLEEGGLGLVAGLVHVVHGAVVRGLGPRHQQRLHQQAALQLRGEVGPLEEGLDVFLAVLLIDLGLKALVVLLDKALLILSRLYLAAELVDDEVLLRRRLVASADLPVHELVLNVLHEACGGARAVHQDQAHTAGGGRHAEARQDVGSCALAQAYHHGNAQLVQHGRDVFGDLLQRWERPLEVLGAVVLARHHQVHHDAAVPRLLHDGVLHEGHPRGMVAAEVMDGQEHWSLLHLSQVTLNVGRNLPAVGSVEFMFL